MSKRLLVLPLFVVLAVLAAACTGAQPVTVVETVEVEKIVEKEVTVVETVEVETVVEKEVVVEKETVVTSRGQGGTLNILYWQAASIPNPYLSSGTKDIEAGSITLEPLANYDETGKLVTKLAAEVPTIENGGVSEDLTAITWTLKEGVMWSDGTPFTAEDVVFTWEYCAHPEAGCASLTNYEGVANVEALDDYTVQITFEAPKPYPYDPFVSGSAPIIQKAQFQDCLGAAAQTCTEQNLNPHGTGAYKIVDFKVNDVVVYNINEFYRDPAKPYFSEVIFKGGGDAASAARAVLETGEADYAWNLQVEPQILVQMEAAGNGKVVNSFAGSVERILVNQTNPDPALGDKRAEWTPEDPNPHPFFVGTVIPQAMSMAIDRSIISNQLYGFAGKPTCNVIPGPAVYASTANDSCLTQDIEGAKALLDEAGIVDSDGDGIREYEGIPLEVLFQTSTNSVRQKTQALIKQWWSEIGIESELKNVDAGVYFGNDPNSPDTYGKFYADLEMYTTGPSVDPQVHLAGWTCAEISSSANQWLGDNNFRGCNEEYDALFAELTQTPVGERRYEIAKTLNDINVQNYYQISLVHRGSVSAHANNLLGVRMNGWDTEMWNIADWTRSGE